ncbi:type II toxin-antitoxin system PemK/MazF family toxin [Undibacterium squillarum]|uniref:Uncharacterized protein n=1 Tax=Undibacterium squillarum TaxID=1131567 RepID=A0ABQ2Y340_9BURK|nr:type II toxin-antitoxin system PemK/MazF family toxin [Undibacterium squillarum]GGX52204.1 hypothetical protein GCM10010946_33540 [Undibacterium squillarum]
MNSIEVKYFELVNQMAGAVSLRQIGSELLNEIDEVLIPVKDSFFIKKFFDINQYVWHVEDVSVSPKTTTLPTIYTIFLRREISAHPIEYLQQTVKKNRFAVSRILWSGTLVEVDYGFFQSAGHMDGQIKSNKRYSDTLQLGEMQKRRLAIVVKAFSNRVQVIPVTSAEPDAGDKSAFKLSRDTLSDLCFYGSSGKDSWALCSMLETVSIRRILPPATYFQQGKFRKQGRKTNYFKKLSAHEKRLMMSALMHSIGVTDYEACKEKLKEQEAELIKMHALEEEITNLQSKYDDLLKKNKELELIKEIAVSWESHFGQNALEIQTQELRDLYQQIQAEKYLTE